jgi:hypothetical protein
MNISCLRTLFGIAITLCVPLTLRADHIVFNDLSENVTVTTDGSTSRLAGPGCSFVLMDPNEDCVLLLTAPSLGALPDFSLFQLVSYSEPGDPLDVSDSLQVNGGTLAFPPFFPFYDIHFSSAENTITPCDTVLNGCIGPETGSIQTAFTLDWFDSTGAIVSTDIISFQSGTVPEPSAIPWLLAASALLGIAIQRRKSAA